MMRQILAYGVGATIEVAELVRANPGSFRARDIRGVVHKIPLQRAWPLGESELPLEDLSVRAKQTAKEEIDTDSLWQLADELSPEVGALRSLDEIIFARYGDDADCIRRLAVLKTLAESPSHFRRGGDGRFIPAARVQIDAALRAAATRRERRHAEDRILRALRKGEMPDEILSAADSLLFAPDKRSPTTRALNRHCIAQGLSPAEFLIERGVVASAYDYHRRRFRFAWPIRDDDEFPADKKILPADIPSDEPPSAFSIDDKGTIEIDDAFSVREISGGHWEIGVHIAAPALAIAPDSAADRIARARMVSVYFPDGKETMLPPTMFAAYSLDAGTIRPTLSLYTIFDADEKKIIGSRTVLDKVKIAANFTPEDFLAEPLDSVAEEFDDEKESPAPFVDDSRRAIPPSIMEAFGRLEQFSESLIDSPIQQNHAAGEGRDFKVWAERTESGTLQVRITRRRRDSPVSAKAERVVARLMVYLNECWGGMLADGGAGLFRHRGRLLAEPPDDSVYAWCSSPLRRYADLVNQRLLLAHLRGENPPHDFHSICELAKNFESRLEKARRFQTQMERYWTLRILSRKSGEIWRAEKSGANRIRLDDLPLGGEAILPRMAFGNPLSARVKKVNLIELRAHFAKVNSE